MKSVFNRNFSALILCLLFHFCSNNSYSQTLGNGSTCNDPRGPQDYDDCQVEILVLFDPNEIIGPEGFDTVHWVSIKDCMGYTINFENDPKLATASAKNVYLYYPVSAKKDITTSVSEAMDTMEKYFRLCWCFFHQQASEKDNNE